jgi:hypothetical protein
MISPDSQLLASRTRYPELLALHRSQSAGHIVQFYENDAIVIEIVSYIASNSLQAGNSSIVITTRPHLERIEEQLIASGRDLGEPQKIGHYIALDAAVTLSQLLVDGWPDKAKFDETIGGVVRRAIEKSTDRFVFAFGEMVALLCYANKAAAAIYLEQLWNELAASYHFSLCCAYPLDSFDGNPDLDAVFQICAQHSLVIPAETLV